MFYVWMFLDQVHIAGAGDFQLSKIELLRDPCPLNLRKGVDIMDSENDTLVIIQLKQPLFSAKALFWEKYPVVVGGGGGALI